MFDRIKSLFGASPKNLQKDFTFLGTDLHSHLIPGIDDGVKSVEESVEMIKGLHDLGFHKIITTPHINGDFYPNTPEIILEQFQQVKQALKKAKLNIFFQVAAEYKVDDFFMELLDENAPLLTLPGNYLLIEFSFLGPPPQIFETIFRLQAKGYKIIIAHPERYLYYEEELSIFKKFKQHQCLLQLNLLSLTGHYGSGPKKIAKYLVKENLIRLAGTDLHHRHHLKLIRNALENTKINQQLSQYAFENVGLIDEGKDLS